MADITEQVPVVGAVPQPEPRRLSFSRRERILSLLAAVVLVVGSFVTTSRVVGGDARSPAESADRMLAVAPPAPAPAALPEYLADAAVGTHVETPVGVSYETEAGHIATELGCLDDLSAASLDDMFAATLGPSMGIDNPHVFHIGGDRYLWLFQDAFLNYSGTTTIKGESSYLHNVAIVQDGRCFRLLHGGSRLAPRVFEEGDQRDTHQRFFWPLGGGVGNDGQLYVFWAEMHNDPKPRLLDGITRHPTRTWIAAYDPSTFERASFQPAPDDGTYPMYGFAVESDDQYSYLFGNSGMLNLSIEGGFGNGPFSATRMFLARVPRGELASQPEYYTGSDWSLDRRAARPISERYYTENTMQPRFIDGRWVAVTKENGFWGKSLVVDVADDPWGPWKTVSQHRIDGVADDQQVTYGPILMPWRDLSGDLIVMISRNANSWDDALVKSDLYRPFTFDEPWPRAVSSDDPGLPERMTIPVD